MRFIKSRWTIFSVTLTTALVMIFFFYINLKKAAFHQEKAVATFYTLNQVTTLADKIDSLLKLSLVSNLLSTADKSLNFEAEHKNVLEAFNNWEGAIQNEFRDNIITKKDLDEELAAIEMIKTKYIHLTEELVQIKATNHSKKETNNILLKIHTGETLHSLIDSLDEFSDAEKKEVIEDIETQKKFMAYVTSLIVGFCLIFALGISVLMLIINRMALNEMNAMDDLSRKTKEMNIILEAKVAERTSELKEAQKLAVINAHQAGMSEIATGVLHNVGNILNSLNIGAETIMYIIDNSECSNFILANALLKENLHRLAEFLSNDPKGKILPEYYFQLGSVINSDFDKLKLETTELQKRIQLIKDVISSQQMHAKGGEFKEEVFVLETIEDALTMQLNALTRHDIQVVKKFSEIAPIIAQKAKLVHVLLNLFKNAKEAMIAKDKDQKILTIEVGNEEQNIFIKISDNGEGISKENRDKIFSHGFTTKKNGHGFGLHFCANAVTEMNGKLSVDSEGPGTGTTFTILLPKKDVLKAS